MVLSPELIKFSNGDTDYLVAFQDYYAHFNKVNGNRDLGAFDNTVSLEEKSQKITEKFFSEIEKRSGVSREGVDPADWAHHPSVVWAAMSVLDATVATILPVTVNPSIGLYTDMRYVGWGDVVKFKVKPRTLYTVSQGN